MFLKSAEASWSWLISIHGCDFSAGGGGGVIVGLTGRVIGGGFGTGRSVVRVCLATAFVGWIEAALCDSGSMSMVIAVEDGRFGAGITP